MNNRDRIRILLNYIYINIEIKRLKKKDTEKYTNKKLNHMDSIYKKTKTKNQTNKQIKNILIEER